MTDNKSHELAVEHVDWFLKTLRSLLIDHFVHGYKHGVDAERKISSTQIKGRCREKEKLAIKK